MKTDLTVDAAGLMCPMPTLRAKQGMLQISEGQTLKLISTDPGSKYDIPTLCRQNNHTLVSVEEIDGQWHFIIQK